MTDLEARYGRTRARTQREKTLGWSVGLGILLIAVAWVWWVGTDPASTQLQSRTIGYVIEDDSTVAVTFEVSVDAGTPVRCAVEALNTAYGVVGWVELDLPPAGDRGPVPTPREQDRVELGAGQQGDGAGDAARPPGHGRRPCASGSHAAG